MRIILMICFSFYLSSSFSQTYDSSYIQKELLTNSIEDFKPQNDIDTAKNDFVKHPMKINLNVTYVTQHYWRGLGRGNLFGKGPALEPQLTFSKNKWSFGVFAGASFDNIYKTLMPFVIYKFTPEFLVGVQDIYSPGPGFWKTNPFNYDLHTSKHFVDYYMTYRMKKIPLQLKWTSIVLGYDPKTDGGRNFSSYTEIASWYNINKWQIDGYVGVTPWKGLYAKQGGINNLEAKLQYNFVINKNVPFPVFVKVANNPISKQSHFVGGCAVNLAVK